MMPITLLLNFIALLLAYRFHSSKLENRDINIFVIYLSIYVGIFPIIAALNFTSPDYHVYLTIINEVPNIFRLSQSIVDNSLGKIHGGIGWIIGISLIKTIIPIAPLVLYVIVFISLYIKFTVIRKHIDYFYITIFIYMSHEVFFKEWIQVRHGLAVSFIVLSLFYLLDKKNLKSYASIVVSILIHKISVVFIPYYFIYRLKNNGVNLLLILLPFSIFLSITEYPFEILRFLGSYIKEVKDYLYWTSYQYEYSLIHPTLLKHYLFITIFVIFRKKLALNSYFNPLFSLYLLSTHYFIIFSFFSLFATRAGASLYFSEALLLAIFVSSCKDKKHAIIGVMIYGTLLFLYNFIK